MAPSKKQQRISKLATIEQALRVPLSAQGGQIYLERAVVEALHGEVTDLLRLDGLSFIPADSKVGAN